MAGVNKVILVGHLGADPEIRSFPSGGRVAQLRLATGESWTDRATGEKKERTEWHTVQLTNDALGGVAEKYLRKGSKAYIEGQLRTRKWQDRDGADRWTTEVVVAPGRGELVLLDRPAGNRPPAEDPGPPGGATVGSAAGTGHAPGFGSGRPFDDDLDDDVPV